MHRLEGLTRQPLVGFPQAPAERDHHARRDIGVFAEQPAHVRAEHRHDARGLDRFNGCRASLVLEQRQLAEDVTRPKSRQRDRAAVAMGADRAGAAFAHDVERVAGVALAKHHLAGSEAAGHSELRDAFEIAALERGEHWHPPEQLDDLC